MESFTLPLRLLKIFLEQMNLINPKLLMSCKKFKVFWNQIITSIATPVIVKSDLKTKNVAGSLLVLYNI